jgi:selenocysteine-specific elongation factor
MYVIGTAGHVDHGKSTLVRALTGIDPDRLKEEKARGMTIDLGFAWIDLLLPGAETTESVGVIDVPGHSDFIKNMLAGVGGIDAVVLIIAADEGVMPQTREHLAILDLLAVPAGVVALTKVDLIDDPEWLELVQLDIAELLRETHLADAPIVPVSATTGRGLIDLRRAIAATLGRLAPRRNRARPRLPIDRVFTLSGFGTIVTGTLSDGPLSVGDGVEVLPTGLAARVRSLQTHRRQVEVGQPGSRLAINLTGVSTDDLRRGDVVVKPGTLQSTQLIDVHFRLLADVAKPLRHNQTVDFFSGAAEVPAIVRLLGHDQLAPGESGWLQLRLARPTVVVSGDHYILRQPSPSATLGGGVVLSPHPRQRWRRFDEGVLARLRTLAKGAPDAILLQTLARRPFLTSMALLTQSELDLQVAQEALAELRTAGAILAVEAGGEPLLLTLTTWEQLTTHLCALLTAFHHSAPLRRGMARGEVRSRLQAVISGGELPVRLFNALIEQAQQVALIGADDAVIWLAGFQVTLTLHQQALVDHLLAEFAKAPFSPPTTQEVTRLLGVETELVEVLLDQRVLVRIGGDVLFRRADFEEMVATVQAITQQQGSITLAQVRDRFQTSRKYAQALLEEMDARRITRREGDIRLLRGGA